MTRKPVTEVPDAQSDPRFMGGWPVAGTEARKKTKPRARPYFVGTVVHDPSNFDLVRRKP